MRQLCFLLLLFSALQSFAQTEVKLTGRVLDEKTLKPLENVGIKLLSSTDRSVIKSSVTDAKGEFVLFSQPGRYHVKIEFIAYKTQLLENREITKNLKIEDIILKEDVQLLKSVDITAEKTTVELSLDKKVWQ
ncbi:carboxypeptidase regulatory-like domain-containing protein [Pedobacter jeongneungensis]|uniref:carboxypeptidase regulatory-like domain-containing protein n=1 Tax=Pedobacter jeongneungensis TaxID=947309 RepID=UPI0013B378CF|nr:carboxypeptidase regulatory-like domain-containing protein [Pedobacter jeongneungensis]